MNHRLLAKIDLYVIGWGVAIVAGAALFCDLGIFVGALAGAALAAANWLAFRHAGLRFAASGARVRFGVFLAFKTILVFAAVALVVLSKVVSPLAFMLGLSSLVLGIITRSAIAALREGEAALEEER